MSKDHSVKSDANSESTSVPVESESVLFLGRVMSRAEQKECGRNLKEFFDLIRSWRKEGADESP